MVKKTHTVVVGITSGIAAFKSLDLVKRLRAHGIDVSVIMTEHAACMVPPHEFEKASGRKVYIQLFEKGFSYKDILKNRVVDHIRLADAAELIAIVPATANCIAKIAHGIADDFLTTTILATRAPVLVCPSMNVHMWNNPLTQKNLTILRSLGYQIVEPGTGSLACGYEGKGRLPDVGDIEGAIIRRLEKHTQLTGKKIMITAGGTAEKIDDIRMITNRSSGKMGAALADACAARGADVLLLRAGSAIVPELKVQQAVFETTEDLEKLMDTHIPAVDICFHTAAVSDFFLPHRLQGKLKSNKAYTLILKPRKKILDRVKILNPTIKLIGFKAEWQCEEDVLIERAIDRMKKSTADAMVVNDVGYPDRGFAVDTNEVIVVLADGTWKKIPLMSKKELAEHIVDFLSGTVL